MVGGGDPIIEIEAPTLADLMQMIARRACWQAEAPLEVDQTTYKRARDEMLVIQQKRGFPLAVASIDRENFMLRGVPIVIRHWVD